ncbi:hypothetical protein D3C87_2006280 [compost metagenome]
MALNCLQDHILEVRGLDLWKDEIVTNAADFPHRFLQALLDRGDLCLARFAKCLGAENGGAVDPKGCIGNKLRRPVVEIGSQPP